MTIEESGAEGGERKLCTLYISNFIRDGNGAVGGTVLLCRGSTTFEFFRGNDFSYVHSVVSNMYVFLVAYLREIIHFPEVLVELD